MLETGPVFESVAWKWACALSTLDKGLQPDGAMLSQTNYRTRSKGQLPLEDQGDDGAVAPTTPKDWQTQKGSLDDT